MNILETPLPVLEHNTSKGLVTFRVARLEDIDALSAPFFGSDVEPDDAEVSQEQIELTRRFFKHLLEQGAVAIIGQQGDEIVGMVYVDLLERQKEKSRIRVDRPTGIIERVRSIIEGEGIGKALLLNAEALIVGAGLEAAEIGVKATNERARRIYQKAGYQVMLEGHIELLPDFEGYSIFRYEPPSLVMFKSLVG
jgi:ribosomal protein S18 acetylase RimI-like enzyme